MSAGDPVYGACQSYLDLFHIFLGYPCWFSSFRETLRTQWILSPGIDLRVPPRRCRGAIIDSNTEADGFERQFNSFVFLLLHFVQHMNE